MSWSEIKKTVNSDIKKGVIYISWAEIKKAVNSKADILPLDKQLLIYDSVNQANGVLYNSDWRQGYFQDTNISANSDWIPIITINNAKCLLSELYIQTGTYTFGTNKPNSYAKTDVRITIDDSVVLGVTMPIATPSTTSQGWNLARIILGDVYTFFQEFYTNSFVEGRKYITSLNSAPIKSGGKKISIYLSGPDMNIKNTFGWWGETTPTYESQVGNYNHYLKMCDGIIVKKNFKIEIKKSVRYDSGATAPTNQVEAYYKYRMI